MPSFEFADDALSLPGVIRRLFFQTVQRWNPKSKA